MFAVDVTRPPFRASRLFRAKSSNTGNSRHLFARHETKCYLVLHQTRMVLPIFCLYSVLYQTCLRCMSSLQGLRDELQVPAIDNHVDSNTLIGAN